MSLLLLEIVTTEKSKVDPPLFYTSHMYVSQFSYSMSLPSSVSPHPSPLSFSSSLSHLLFLLLLLHPSLSPPFLHLLSFTYLSPHSFFLPSFSSFHTSTFLLLLLVSPPALNFHTCRLSPLFPLLSFLPHLFSPPFFLLLSVSPFPSQNLLLLVFLLLSSTPPPLFSFSSLPSSIPPPRLLFHL
jgi:hypothetical protein